MVTNRARIDLIDHNMESIKPGKQLCTGSGDDNMQQGHVSNALGATIATALCVVMI